MSRLAEVSLVQHLTTEHGMAYLVREGIEGHLISDESLREVVGWSIGYYAQNGYRTAPTVSVMREVWGDLLDRKEVDLDDEPEASIEWAIGDLKDSYVYSQSSEWAKQFVMEVANAGPGERPDVLAAHTQKLLRISTALDSRIYRQGAQEGLDMALRNFEDRQGTTEIRGMRMGFGVIDQYTMGIHDGELAILAAGPKTGKSFYLAYAALQEWRAGRNVMLFSLENSIEMTWDRIFCMANGVRYNDWQLGRSSPEEVQRIREWRATVEASGHFIVAKPPPGRRSFESMIGEARVHEVDSVFIDQLTFVEMPGNERKAKTERIGDALHALKNQITMGHKPIPCLVAHQINREGVKQADKVGYLEMYHLADSAEVERTADWVFGLYASRDDKLSRRADFQVLAARRAELKNWHMHWDVNAGSYDTRHEFTIGQSGVQG